MLLLAGLFYLLLCQRVRVRLCAYVCDGKGSTYLEIIFLGLHMRLRRAQRKREESRSQAIRDKLVRLKRNAAYLKKLLALEYAGVYLRLGLEDAALTAAAAGACSAALHAAAALPACRGRCLIRIEPDYRRAGLSLYAQGIFSAMAGDIMFAALCAAISEGGKRIRHRSGVKADG